MQRFCITFAGAVGSSKTPIAFYLSQKFSLPIMNNDSIRTEVAEELLEFNNDEYEKRRDARLKEILERGITFIYDASIDRKWESFKEQLSNYHYSWFIISLDLSKELLTSLYQVKGYHESLERIDQLVKDHTDFLEKFGDEVGVHIVDSEFTNRLQIAEEAVNNWRR